MGDFLVGAILSALLTNFLWWYKFKDYPKLLDFALYAIEQGMLYGPHADDEVKAIYNFIRAEL
jgi:hypothetical protein